MSRLFNICTDFLVLLTRVFHTDYKSISVWINIYFQGFVLFAAAATSFIATLMKTIDNLTIMKWIWLAMCLLQMVVVACACWRYRPPLDEAFDRCYMDLERLTSKIHISYSMLNVLIFVVIYLICLFFDIFLLF